MREAWVGRGHYTVNARSRENTDNNSNGNNQEQQLPGIEPLLGAQTVIRALLFCYLISHTKQPSDADISIIPI